ncbi:MAG: TolC family protein [Opitutales bacterium]|nr:TolC family protein [Opitutales bacterium]
MIGTYRGRVIRTAGLVLLLLGGCATVERESLKEGVNLDVPSGWSRLETDGAAAHPEDLTAWWTRFHDSVLTRLVEQSLISGSEPRLALSRMEQSRSRKMIQRSSLLPSVGAGMNGSGNKTWHTGPEYSTKSDSYGASVDVSWEADVFGRLGKELDAADADFRASMEDYYGVRISLAAEVASTYILYRMGEAQLANVEAALAMREQTHQVVLWQAQAGEADSMRAEQSQVSVEQARSMIPGMRQSLLETRHTLALLCGMRAEEVTALLQDGAELPVVPRAVAMGIPWETLRQRPDIRSAEIRLEASMARLDATERGRYPSLSLSGSVGVESWDIADIFAPEKIISSIAARMVASVWDGGRTEAGIRIEGENVRQAWINYEHSVRKALSEVENALGSIRASREKLNVLARAVASGRESTRLARIQYEVGNIDLTTMLDAERTLLGLEQDYIVTRAEEIRSHIQLYKSMGGGWSALP